MMNGFLGALQVLTILPVRTKKAALADSAIFFPIVGALLALPAAGVVFVGGPVASLLAIIWLMAVTGCLHEDGIADVADAFRAGRSRERIMEILKDSRIGSYGAAALLMTTLVRWQALAQCTINADRALPAALALSRASLVVMAHFAPPVGEGLGQEFARGCTRTITAVVTAQAIAFSFLAGWRLALMMIVASGVTIALARIYFLRRLGGVNGDCLGATCVVVETVNLVILAWRHSI